MEGASTDILRKRKRSEIDEDPHWEASREEQNAISGQNIDSERRYLDTYCGGPTYSERSKNIVYFDR